MSAALELPKKPKRKSKPKPCNTPHCRGRTYIRKSGKSKGGKCAACRVAAWRKNQPVRAAFVRLRAHAAQRGILFTIPFEHFKEFAEESEYVTKTGNERGSLTVDRIDNLRGYEPGNIRAITRSENSIKRAKFDEIRTREGYAWRGRA